jgi:hypothetical protein
MATLEVSEMKGRKLGRVLTKMGKVSREQVHEALTVQKTRKAKIGEILTELGYVTERDVREALAGQAGMAFIDLGGAEIPQDALDAVPAENVHAYGVIPVAYSAKGKRLKVAIKSPDNFQAVDDLRLLMGFTVEAVVADPDGDRRTDREALREVQLGRGCRGGVGLGREVRGLSGHSDAVGGPGRGDGGGGRQPDRAAVEPRASSGDQGPGVGHSLRAVRD